MILSHAKSEKAILLLFLCTYYLADELNMHDVTQTMSPDMDRVLDVYKAVWGPDGRRDLLDRLLADNTIGLTRAEKDIVSQWRDCVYGRFSVHSEGSKVYYLAGDYAIEVCGCLGSADRLGTARITYGETLLLPYDGVVIYGGWVKDLSGTVAEEREGLDRAVLEDVLRAGHVVRSAREFVLNAPEIREVLARIDLDAQDVLSPVSGGGVRGGALAGMSWDERNKAVADDLMDNMGYTIANVLRDRLDEMAIKGKPTTSLRAIFTRLKKYELQNICDSLGAYYTSKATKATLTDIALDSIPMDTEALWRQPVFLGASRFRGVRTILEAGGRIDVDSNDFDTLQKLPFEMFPLVTVFRSGSTYSFVVANEIRRILEMGDFDELDRRAQGIDRACRYALLSAEFRGIVPLPEVAFDCVELLGVEEEPADILMAIAMRADLGGMPVDMAQVGDETFLISIDLGDTEGAHVLDEADEDFACDILDSHDEMTPRPLWRLVADHGYKDLMDYMLDQGATHELVHYLDAHVPANQSDLYFAEAVIESLSDYLVMVDPVDFETRQLVDILEECGLIPPAEDMELVEGLLDAFAKVMPNWYANGWPVVGRRLQLV